MALDALVPPSVRAHWQLYAIGGGVLGVGYYVYAKRQAAAQAAGDAASSTADASGAGTIGGGATIIQPTQIGPRGPAGPVGKTGPAGKAPAPVPAGHPKAVPPSINAASFPKMISAIKPAGFHLFTFGHTTKGGHVGNVTNGAPVYALVQTGFGPVWEQGQDLSKLPVGTPLATLQQFSSSVRK